MQRLSAQWREQQESLLAELTAREEAARTTLAREQVEAAAREDGAVKQHLAGLAVRKVIVVPGRIVNIVAS